MPSRPLPVEPSEPAPVILATVGLSSGYANRAVLHQVDLQLARGELLALVGTNGAGKSTLLKTIIGLVPASSGSIEFAGSSINSWSPHERARRGLAYVMQSGAIFPSLSVQDNLQASTADIPEGARAKGIESALAIFDDVRALLSRRAGLLSGGQRQMLALTMVLARQPAVLLLDEPCAGLAPDLVTVVLERLQEVCASRGASVILVEQNVRAALGVAHRALLMERGRITLETAQPQEWQSSENLEKLLWGTDPADPAP